VPMFDPELPIFLKGMNYKTAPIEIRERIQKHINADGVLERLSGAKDVEGGVLIKTCNRIELYEHAQSPDPFFLKDFDLDESMVYHKKGFEAVHHLFEVSSSLDSMVIGEPQILGQVKQAYGLSKMQSCMSSLLDHVFQRAFHVAKKVRHETCVGDFSVSISSIAVDLCREFFDTLEGKEVLLLGAGQMAQAAAKHFQTHHLKHLWVINRSVQRAFDLAQQTGGTALGFEHMMDKLKTVDILMVSTAAQEHLVSKSEILEAMQDRKRRPLVCIDLSVPRNIDPVVHDLSDVYLYDIDDLQNVVNKHVDIRSDHAKEAFVLVKDELAKFKRDFQNADMSQTARLLREKGKGLCRVELKHLEKNLNLAPETKDRVEQAFQHLSEKMLLNPILYIRDASTDAERSRRVSLVQEIFGLDTKS